MRFTQKHRALHCYLYSTFLLFVEDLHMLCVMFITLKVIAESGDSKKNLKKESQIRGRVERISICVTGSILLIGFLKLSYAVHATTFLCLAESHSGAQN